MLSNRENLVMIDNGVRYTGRFFASTTPGFLVYIDPEFPTHRPGRIVRASR
jgi:hypothetical protein